MAFFRQRGASLTLIHGVRTSSGVRQKILHTFASVKELHQLLESGGWPKFCMSIEQKFPHIVPNWDEIKRQAVALPSQPALDFEPPFNLGKLRSALAFVGRELSHLDTRKKANLELLLGLGPELKDCALQTSIWMGIASGRTPEQARDFAHLFVPDPEAIESVLDQARAALDARNWKRAERLFTEARERDPFDPDILNSEGVGWLDRGQLPQASECFERARALAERQLPRADRVYSWSNLLVRPFIRASSNLALTCERQKDYAGALELYKECLERCPDDGCSVRFLVGPLHQRLGQFQEAWQTYREATLGNLIDLPDTYFDGATVLIELNREDEAVEWMLRGIAINTHIPEVMGMRKLPRVEKSGSVNSWEWACGYVMESSDLWSPAARALLKRVVSQTSVRALLGQLSSLEAKLQEPAPSQDRGLHVHQLFTLRRKLNLPEFAHEVLADLQQTRERPRPSSRS
jgi:tetratricopeptide (TPR) repeat protein